MGSQRSWQGLDLHCYRRSRCLLLFVVLLALPLSATTYYVDNCVVTGSDSNNGTSPSTPWLTIARVNAQSFNAGDSVNFQGECVWGEGLQPPSSGTAVNSITFQSYGTGQAIISGFNVITGWSSVGGTAYSATDTTQPYVVTYNGTLLFHNSGAGSSVSVNQWDWASNLIYVNVGGTISGTLAAGTRNFAVNVVNQSYITINGLTLMGANAAAAFLNTNAAHIVLQNNTISNSFQGIANSTDSGSNNLIQNNTIYDTVQYGILLNNTSATNYTIQNNEIRNVGSLGGTLSDMQGIFASTGAGLLIQYNYIHNGGDSTADHCIYLAATNGASSTAIVRYNNLNNWLGDGIKVSNSQYVDVYSNIIYGVGAAGITVEAGSPSYVNLYNNTIANSAAGTGAYGVNITAGNYITFKNNIIYNINYIPSSYLSEFNIYIENSPTNLAIDYNVVYDPTPNASGYYANYNGTAKTWAAWQAAGYDTHSVKADPKFTNPGSSIFTLQSSSPAIDAGTNLGATYQMGLNPSSSWPSSVSTLNHNFGAGWEIGAFVFGQQIPPAPPTSLTATVK